MFRRVDNQTYCCRCGARVEEKQEYRGMTVGICFECKDDVLLNR
jgi:DNA-directed RNA polymerase subunit RPC12/RpoP